MSSLTPDLALAYLRELSADFRAGIVLDAAARPLAGEPTLDAPARALLHAHPEALELHGTAANGAQVFAVRADHGAIVVVTGPHALPRLTRVDIRTALYATASESAQVFCSEHPDPAHIEALVTAAADAFRRQSVISESD